MNAKEVVSFKVMSLPSFVILFLLLVSVASGEELYTRTDELSCGDAKVQAVTTCTEETNPYFPRCTGQHFIFSNQRGRTSVRVKASGEPGDDRIGTMPALGGLAGNWACVKGKAGLYILIDYWTGGNCETCEWCEVFDLKGRKVLTDKTDKYVKTDREMVRFNKKWDSLGLPDPWPEDSFISIKVLKTDR